MAGYYSRAPGRFPRYKRYLDEMPGVPVSDDWDDIRPINSQAQERLGYPTQKPLPPLLERVISTSGVTEGDAVLTHSAGCGTAVHAAPAKVAAQMDAGMSVTHLAISLIEKRLKDAFPGLHYVVHGTRKT